MKKLTLFIISSVVLQACAIFSKYDFGQHRIYAHSLTLAEKTELCNGKSIIKDWNGTNDLGDVDKGRILIKMTKRNKYNFIEIGKWESTRLIKRQNKKNGYLKSQSEYDSLGNLIKEIKYFREKGQDKFFLVEALNSDITNVDSTACLIQTITTYYPNGKTKSRYTLLSKESNEEKSEFLKPEILLENPKYYDENGKEVDYLPNEYSGLITFTQMK